LEETWEETWEEACGFADGLPCELPLLGGLNVAGPDSRVAGPLLANASPARSAVCPVPSFQSVYRQYFDFVWSSARRFGVESESMDDLVQEVFIVIHAKLETLDKPEALRSWIYGVVRRVVSTHRRARRGRLGAGLAVGFAGEVASHEPTPLEQTETNAELQLVASLLAELDEPKREVFGLVELEGLTVPEAAEVLAIPLNTAYSRLRAARQAFEAALARHEARSSQR
jgi:RNA polymerase sigma-70 factor (ECF subfamily)